MQQNFNLGKARKKYGKLTTQMSRNEIDIPTAWNKKIPEKYQITRWKLSDLVLSDLSDIQKIMVNYKLTLRKNNYGSNSSMLTVSAQLIFSC